MHTLGNYTLLEAVGVGSTGTVWRATQTGIQRTVAVKILADGVSQDLLREEARVLASLDHPNVVKVYDFVGAGHEAPSDPAYLVEEWVEGQRLDELVNGLRPERLTAEQGIGVVRGGLMGLAYAHDATLVHGDVSAGNILIDSSGTSKLIDFGLASPVGGVPSEGTPGFTSPEVAQGLAVTAASDVFSAAAVLYFLLAGEPPVADPSSAAMPRLRDHGDGLADLLARSMDTDPANRPQNAAAFLAELEERTSDRYGAGWLAKASVAGLVTAPAAGVATVVAAAGSGAATAVEAPTAGVIVAGAAADTGKGARRGISKGPLAAAGAVALIVGVVVAIVATSGSDKKSTVSTGGTPAAAQPVSSSSPNESPTPTPTVAPVIKASEGLVGKYTKVERITVSTVSTEPAGTTFPASTWTITRGCSSIPCQVPVISSNGRHYDALFDGHVLTFTYSKTETHVCVDDAEQPVAGTSATITSQVNYRLVFGDTESPRGFTGTGAAVQKAVAVSGNCVPRVGTESRTVTGNRV